MFAEFDDSPTETYTQTGYQGQRRFHGPYEDRYAFVEELLSDPSFILNRDAIASNLDIKPLGKISNNRETSLVEEANEYLEAEVTVTYTVEYARSDSGTKGDNDPLSEPYQDGYYTIQISSDNTIHTLEGGGEFKWHARGDEPLPPDINTLLHVPTMSIELRLNQVSEPDFVGLNGILKKCNQQRFQIPVWGVVAPPETLFFDTYTATLNVLRGQLYNRQRAWDVQCNMVFRTLVDDCLESYDSQNKSGTWSKRPVTWNDFYSSLSSTPGWQYLTSKDGALQPLTCKVALLVDPERARTPVLRGDFSKVF